MGLIESTQALLEGRDKRLYSLKWIADESGLGYDWLLRFNRGEWQDPGAVKVQRLHDFLKARCST